MSQEAKVPAAGKVKKRKRTWWQRIKLTFWILVAIAVGLRLSLYLLLPYAMHRAAAYYDLDCDYDRVELSLLGGDVGIWGLRLRPHENGGGGEPLVQAEYARAKIKPWKLLIGRLDVERLEADGADLLVDRDANGRMPLVERFLKTASTTATTTQKPIDLSAPLKVDATRVTHLRAHFRDERAKPVFETTVALDLRISDMGSATKPTEFEATLAADKLVDVVRISGDAKSSGRVLDANISVLVRGLKLKPVAGYLAPWGIRPVANEMSLRLKGHVTTGPLPDPSTGMKGVLTIEGAQWTADGIESAGLDKLTLEAQSLDAGIAKFSRLIIEGVRGQAGRSPDGHLQMAGIEFVKPAAAEGPVAAAPVAAPPAGGAAAGAPTFRWELQEFLVKDLKAGFHDEAVTPPADVGLELDSVSAKFAPGTGGLDVTASGRAPGLAASLSAEGTYLPQGDKKVLAMKLHAKGVRGDAIKPYLDALGLECTLKSGELNASLDASAAETGGTAGGDLQLSDVSLTDQGTKLFGLKNVHVTGLGVDGASGKVKVGAVEIVGPTLRVRREANGALAGLGVRTVAERGAVRAGDGKNAGGGAAWALPRIELGKFSWTGIGIAFEDDAVAPATKIRVGDAGVEISDLLIDLDAAGQPGKTGTIRAWAAVPGMAEKLSMEGTVTPGEHSVAAQLKFSGTHVNAAALAPYLKEFGIEPTLKDGDLQCDVMANAAKAGNGVTGSMAVTNARLADGPVELATMKACAVDGVTASAGELRVAKVTIDSPTLAASRDAAGVLATCGLRILPKAAGAEAIGAPTPSAPEKAAGQVVRVGLFHVAGAQVSWKDALPAKAVQTVVSGNLDLSDLVWGAKGVSTIRAEGKIAGAVDRMAATGTVQLAPEDLQADLSLEASGVRAGTLEGYLPAGVAVTLKDGSFTTQLTAALQKNPAGGQKAAVEFKSLQISDGGAKLFAAADAKVQVSRLDMDQRVVEIADIGTEGVDADVHRTKDGMLEVAGLRIGGAVPEPVAQAYQKLSLQGPPLVKVDHVDLKASRLEYSDEALPSPIVMTDVSLENALPVQVLGRDAAMLPASKFVIEAAIEPAVKQVRVDLSLAPFAAEPVASAKVEASGVNGKGLAELLPLLNKYGEAGTLTDGVLKVQAGAALKLDRRSPLEFDFSRPFEATVWVKELGFQASAEGPVLAGVKGLQLEGIHVDPRSRVVAVKTIEVDEPIGRASLTKDGLAAMGMVLKLPESAATQAAATQIASSTQSVPKAVAAQPPAPWEVRVNKLLVSGIDMQMEDARVTPPLVIPLTGLEFEASNLSSRAMTESKPIRFSILTNAGKVQLTKADGSGPEQRELFSQMVGSGKMTLYPKPSGWVKLSISGLEMEALSGEAKREGVALSRGQFDGTVDARFHGDGTGKLQMRLVATDMRLSEPANGPIQHALNSPTPLDGIIGILEDPDGSITVPLNLSLKGNELSPGSIAGAVPGALAHVVLTAMASAPVKAINGLFGGKKKLEKLQPVTVAFAPGVATLDAAAMKTLEGLALRMRNDKRLSITLSHDLGMGDVAREAARSTPSSAETLSMVAQLRARKAELTRLWVEQSGVAVGQMASRSDAEAEAARARLKAIEQEMTQADDALDAVTELLKPGAQGQANRRTRAAALELSKERLMAVRSALVDANIADVADRVQTAVPAFKPLPGQDGGRVVSTLVRMR